MSSAQHDFVADITDVKESWSIVVRVLHLWSLPDLTRPRIPYSLDMVLVDERGDRIHAYVGRTLIYKFHKDLKEGSVYSMSFFGVVSNDGHYRTTRHQYKLNFQFATKVLLHEGSTGYFDCYSFIPLADIFQEEFDTDYLVDVIGLLTGVGIEREFQRNETKTKMNVIKLESDGFKTECALFGPCVDELNAFRASGKDNNAIVFVLFAKVKSFKGEVSLQNAINCTKLIFNSDSSHAVDFRKRMCENGKSPSQALSQLQDSPKISIEDDFLVLTSRKTIKQLKDSEKELTCVVLATVERISEGKQWWYTACSCHKAVFLDFRRFFCSKCNRHVSNVVPRYKISIQVIDNTGPTTFVIFDRDASQLLNKSCVDMIQSADKVAGSSTLPREIPDLVNKSFLFKVEFKKNDNPRFDQSFCVKRMCSDPSILQKFRDLYSPTVDVFSVGHCSNDEAKTCVVVQLMVKLSGDKGHFDLRRDSNDLTPTKRNCADGTSDNDDNSNVKIQKTQIKIEKE